MNPLVIQNVCALETHFAIVICFCFVSHFLKTLDVHLQYIAVGDYLPHSVLKGAKKQEKNELERSLEDRLIWSRSVPHDSVSRLAISCNILYFAEARGKARRRNKQASKQATRSMSAFYERRMSSNFLAHLLNTQSASNRRDLILRENSKYNLGSSLDPTTFYFSCFWIRMASSLNSETARCIGFE